LKFSSLVIACIMTLYLVVLSWAFVIVLVEKCFIAPMLTALVVGAGPSGLVAAKILKENGYQVSVVEASGNIGGTFANKAYDNAELVSSKYITSFSDFRFESDAPDHPSLENYVEYLGRYCTFFSLWKHIRFHSRLVRLSKRLGKHVALVETTQDGGEGSETTRAESEYDCVAVCSGLHDEPYIPEVLLRVPFAL